MNARAVTSPAVDLALRLLLWALLVVVTVVALAPDLLLLDPGVLSALFAPVLGPIACGVIGVTACVLAARSQRPALAMCLRRAFREREDLAAAASASSCTSYALGGAAFVLLTLPGPRTWLATRDALGLATTHLGLVLVLLGVLRLVLTLRALRRHRAPPEAPSPPDDEPECRAPPSNPATPVAWFESPQPLPDAAWPVRGPIRTW